MKTLIKITTFAVIAAFALFSCAPEAELSGVNWKKVHAKNNSGKNSGYTNITGQFSVTGNLSTAANSPNEVTITFPLSSDFLKAGSATKVAEEVEKFLSFHHFTTATNSNEGVADKPDEAKLPYTYVKRSSNVVTFKLTGTFATSQSNVIAKIDGTKYTFANGNKIDNVVRGISGEAVYDDHYLLISVAGSSVGGTFTNRPGNKTWYLTLNAIYTAPSASATANFTGNIATLTTSGVSADIRDEVAKLFQDGDHKTLKIQEFTDGSWSDVTPAPTITYSAGTFSINTPLARKDLVPLRVVWEGRASVTTEKPYFGVKQYIQIRGANTTGTWKPEFYKMGRVYGAVINVWYNTNEGRRFAADESNITDVSVYSCDSFNKNVVLLVRFDDDTGLLEGGGPHWLKPFNEDKQTFKNNFKIAYNSTNDVSFTSTNVVYIPIHDFEYIIYRPNNEASRGMNAIKITLDPNYQIPTSGTIPNKYFYISPVICYSDNRTTFGSATNVDNFMNGCFEFYDVGNSF